MGLDWYDLKKNDKKNKQYMSHSPRAHPVYFFLEEWFPAYI